MPSINRPLSGDVLVFDLAAERALMGEPGSTRSARTLIKSGPLRVTLVALAPGGEIAEHHADGPITVHVLDGHVRFTAGDDHYDLDTGALLTAAGGVRHRVASERGGTFLLTVTQPGDAP